MTEAADDRVTPSAQDGVTPDVVPTAGNEDSDHDRILEDPQDSEYSGLPPSRKLEVWSAIAAIALTSALAVLARLIEVRNDVGGIDPRWWPTVLGVGGLAISIALLVVVLFAPLSREDTELASRAGWIRLAIAVTLAVLYVIVWPLIGYIPATVVFLAAITAVFGGKGWRTLIVFPIGMTAFIYLLFHMLLKVPL